MWHRRKFIVADRRLKTQRSQMKIKEVIRLKGERSIWLRTTEKNINSRMKGNQKSGAKNVEMKMAAAWVEPGKSRAKGWKGKWLPWLTSLKRRHIMFGTTLSLQVDKNECGRNTGERSCWNRRKCTLRQVRLDHIGKIRKLYNRKW